MTARQMKIARSRLNWSQKRLAKELGFKVFCISRYENGYNIHKSVDLAMRYLLIRERGNPKF
ncbi:MAG TPA: hypothetical protein ENH82_13075 [bacterium]|nr:hypothetical protein [bacterium]